MYILDTIIVSNYLDKRRNFPLIGKKIRSKPPESIFVSIITVEEIIQGLLAIIQKSRQKSSVINAYQEFEELFEALHRFQILPYTSEAEQIYQSLSPKVKRVGTQDCRIAATACSKGYIVVTANVGDFERIGIVSIEDWTQ
ncbi:hypothetical protein DSM106972_004000 [Dulcicalothrix desertica PCC 7102]|uniref:PIN domain-containing protein n=1 Tax=Dulcicalothrix desertica PCC 7102 TaxID=232991 RepID=A0A3S1DH72_9CYAN|nr:type II toxin-antitoxin system VapC family toxin [Dulcicalothrix desertica]RUT09905.1 hypothetical protein DSM106972_004000 [Dulcicalothrix desertica PCC 7102]TWH51089.1 tRNA(fMet)-specific endonuclease VapC [Dulcicalothrix desertica PCC 7102]TWH51096.1 tRNA(fMet)-specific endonuclease VapC [Dulcicalothrix desertica PCC 7102]